MTCPYCNFKFNLAALVGGNLEEMEDIAPVICEMCAEVSLLEYGRIRKVNEVELFALKQSPAWKHIELVRDIIASQPKQ